MDYFTADLHFGHANILKYSRRTALMTPEDRASFEGVLASGSTTALASWKASNDSLARMDDELATRINERVGENDRLWIVGDFANPRKATAEILRAYRERIRCRDVRLVWGNHDARHLCAELFTSTYEAVRLLVSAKGTFVEADMWATHDLRSLRAKIAESPQGRVLYLSHYAHVVWHHSDRGVYHLYGHSHGNLERWREAHMPNALAIDIGCDCWDYRPVSFAEIDAALAEKKKRVPPHTVDHHGRMAEFGRAEGDAD